VESEKEKKEMKDRSLLISSRKGGKKKEGMWDGELIFSNSRGEKKKKQRKKKRNGLLYLGKFFFRR